MKSSLFYALFRIFLPVEFHSFHRGVLRQKCSFNPVSFTPARIRFPDPRTKSAPHQTPMLDSAWHQVRYHSKKIFRNAVSLQPNTLSPQFPPESLLSSSGASQTLVFSPHDDSGLRSPRMKPRQEPTPTAQFAQPISIKQGLGGSIGGDRSEQLPLFCPPKKSAKNRPRSRPTSNPQKHFPPHIPARSLSNSD